MNRARRQGELKKKNEKERERWQGLPHGFSLPCVGRFEP